MSARIIALMPSFFLTLTLNYQEYFSFYVTPSLY